MTCSECIRTYRKSNKSPPCENCKLRGPYLTDYQQLICEIFTTSITQVIIAPTKVYDLNYLTVKMLMDLYDIEHEDQLYVFDAVRNMFHYYLDMKEDKIGDSMLKSDEVRKDLKPKSRGKK